jgi:hypothetical protein
MPTLKNKNEKMKTFLVAKPMTEEYAKNLWYIVSGAVEGGLGGGSWGFIGNPASKGYKDYNTAGEPNGIPYSELLIEIKLRDLEGEEDLSKFKDVTAVWLHNKLCKFVTDEKQPDWLREMYAAMLATREHPANADAVSDDAVMQYFFANEIIFG